MGCTSVKGAQPFMMRDGGPVFWLRHSIVQSAAVIAGGTAAAQVIGIATTPILTRLYGPEAFGTLTVLIGLSTALLPIVGMSYSAAIVVPAAQADAVGLLRLSLALTIAICALLGCGLVAFLQYAPNAWKSLVGISNQEQMLYWLLVPILLAGGISLAFQAWLVRTKSFSGLSQSVIAAAALGALIKSIGGFLNASAITLVVAHTLAAFISASLLAAAAFRSLQRVADAPRLLTAKGGSSLLNIAHRYREFPLYSMPRDLLNGISAGFPAVMFAAFGDVATSGFYGLARTVLSVPAGLVTQSLATALLPHLAGKAQTRRPIRPLLLKSMAALALVGAPIFGPLFCAAPYLFRLVFGPEWAPAGMFAQWLSLWCYCTFIDLPCAQAVRFLGLQRAFLVHELVTTLARFAAVYGGLVWLRDPMHSIMLLSLVGVAANVILVLWVLPCAESTAASVPVGTEYPVGTDDC
jgi:O-antigen/teichoic acid export membrane protein